MGRAFQSRMGVACNYGKLVAIAALLITGALNVINRGVTADMILNGKVQCTLRYSGNCLCNILS